MVWIKTANGPSHEHVAWLKDMLETTDKKPGPWEVFSQNDPDRIVLAQLRGAISLQSHLKQIALPDNPEDWKTLVESAPDPVTALTVPPNPTIRQFRRVLAKAMATGQLEIHGDGTFALASSSDEVMPLGKSLDSVERVLGCRWPELVFVETTFGRDLVVDEDRIMAMLGEMGKQVLADSPNDPRIVLIDPTAVEECRIQAEILLPRLRRIRKANQIKVSQWHTVDG